MAEATILICDYCGRDAIDTVRFKTLASRNGNLDIDVCDRHLKELKTKAHKPKRGKRPNGS